MVRNSIQEISYTQGASRHPSEATVNTMSDETNDLAVTDDFPEEAWREWWSENAPTAYDRRHAPAFTDEERVVNFYNVRETALAIARWAWARRSEVDRYRPTEADMNAQERKAREKIEALEAELKREQASNRQYARDLDDARKKLRAP